MSKKLRLTLACGEYEITRPLIDGRVQPEGIDLVVVTPESRERHWRVAREQAYDICEFNTPAYFMGRYRGLPYTSLPVYLHRRFRHGFVFVNSKKGFREPKDLIGARIGGTNYQPASNIWMRGILEEFYGLPHRSVTWVTERDEDIPFDPPPGLTIERLPAGGPSLEERVISGELDGLLTPTLPKSFLAGNPNIVRLFSDYRAVEMDYWKKNGIFPIMHVTIIREEILKRDPWVGPSLARAFDKAKNLAYGRVRNPRVVPLAWFSEYWDEQQEVMGSDPWVYGLGPENRRNLETILRYTHQQGLIGREMTVDELFVDTDETGYGGAGGD
jgi:4,5-dihydroxyphthalate decarboxylase